MDTPPEPQAPATVDADSIEALRHELALARRACTLRERELLRVLPENRYQIWRAAKAIGIHKRSVQLLLRRPRFRRALAALEAIGLAELCITNRMVLEEYVTLAKSNLQDFHDENGNALPPHKWPPERAGAVQEYYVDKDGVTRIKLHDKGRPLDSLAKYQRLTPDRVELTGKDGAPLIPKTVDDLTDEQLATIAARGRAAPAESETGSD